MEPPYGLGLVVIDRPEPREPRLVEESAELNGARMILVQPPPAEPYRRDLRAWGNPFLDRHDVLSLRVCTELAWYRMALGGGDPRPGEWAVYVADQLWVE